MKREFMLYAMEKEGLLTTRESNINRAIKMLVDNERRGNSIAKETILKVCELEDATPSEMRRIDAEVAKKIW